MSKPAPAPAPQYAAVVDIMPGKGKALIAAGDPIAAGALPKQTFDALLARDRIRPVPPAADKE